MPYSERAGLKDERRPLIRDPVWSYSHRYGDPTRECDEEQGDLLGLDNPKSQRFHWIVFLGVTFISILVLLATLGVLVKLSQTPTPVGPKIPTTIRPIVTPRGISTTTTTTTTSAPAISSSPTSIATTPSTSTPTTPTSSVAPNPPVEITPSPPQAPSEQPS